MNVAQQESQVVNVCFHGIGEPARQLEDGEAPYWVTRARFLDILDLLTDRPEVRISFDDSNSSDLDIAMPALLDRRLTATFFVLAGRLTSEGSLDADAVRELSGNGMTIGTHGMDHRPWRGMDAATTRRELVEARDLLRAVTNTVVDEAALPLGRYDRRSLRALKSAGYRRIYTSDRQWASSASWLQPRFSVRSEDSVRTISEQVLTRASPLVELKARAVSTLKRLR